MGAVCDNFKDFPKCMNIGMACSIIYEFQHGVWQLRLLSMACSNLGFLGMACTILGILGVACTNLVIRHGV